jgi:hypothetical protein
MRQGKTGQDKAGQGRRHVKVGTRERQGKARQDREGRQEAKVGKAATEHMI